jgi:hypothetical protein
MHGRAGIVLAGLGLASAQVQRDVAALLEASAGSGSYFLDNRVRFPSEPCFVGSAASMRVGAAPGALLFQGFSADGCQSVVVRLSFEGADPSVQLEPLDPRPGLHHFFLGNDPSKWRTNIRAYGAIQSSGLYPGIDLLVRGVEGGFEYDLFVAPGADLSQVVVRCEGIESLAVDPVNGAVLETPLGDLLHPPGRCWQRGEEGSIEEVSLLYRRIDDGRFGFEVPGRDPAAFLTIDPRLVWSTYLGGIGGGSSVGDIARSVALDREGNVTVIGNSEGGINGGGFPMTPGTFQSPAGLFEDIFVTRFRASTGTLVYSSLIGGFTHEDRGYDVAVDASGRATVVGWTASPDFPTTPGAFQTTKQPTSFTGFVFRLSPLGEDLEYSTFLEGTLGSEAYAVVLAASGAAIVGGHSSSPDFPTTAGAFDETPNGGKDVFVTRLDPSGSALEWSTLLGGNVTDTAYSLTLGSGEEVVLTGRAGSANFPTTPGAFDTGIPFGADAFAARIDSTGSQLLWSTFLGGRAEDIGLSLATLANGDVLIGGVTESVDFPTTPGAFQPSPIPGGVIFQDGFITRLDATGSRLVFSTLLGGTEADSVDEVAIDASGVITTVGSTCSTDFPLTPGAFDTDPFAKNYAIFVSRLTPGGSKLVYSSLVGGFNADYGEGLAVSPTRRVTLAGHTQSPDYPTTPDALQPSPVGGQADAVVTTMDMVLQGVQQLGASDASCIGLLDLNAMEMPVAGSQTFGLYCSGAPPLAGGALVVSVPGGAPGTLLPGPGKLGTVTGPTFVRYVTSDAAGYVEKRFPLPAGSSGMKLLCQLVFQNPPQCTGESPSSSSNRLLLTVQ